ncbi:hypothetical protein [Tamaricihabitans halophyticus]|nr:hypothetical protein [Tamaricihabitans halophyticus]
MATRVVATTFVVVGLAACGSEPTTGPPHIPDEWVQILDEQLAEADQVGEIPMIDGYAGCELFDPPEVGSGTPKPSGAGVSTFGEDGERYICEFSEPPITFVIGRTASAEGFTETTLSSDNPQVEMHEVAGVSIPVHVETYPNGRQEQMAQIIDKQRKVFVSADMETKPSDVLPKGWDTADTARMLADFVRSGD